MSQLPATSSGAGPAQPQGILRGHKAQVHAAVFIRGSERLATGDADGFVVLWDLIIMRPSAVWRAHQDVMLGICGWGHDRLITHGRDNKLIVWKMGVADEAALSRVLPLDPCPEPRPQPWILHIIEVNTMNFCTFSLCENVTAPSSPPQEALVAVPNTLALEAIDIYHITTQRREHTVKLGNKDGMVMALALLRLEGLLTLVVAYENGAAVVAQATGRAEGDWMVKYRAKAHSQPILSLDVAPAEGYFLTSSADSLVSKHPLPKPATGDKTTSAGQDGTQAAGASDSAISTMPSQDAPVLSEPVPSGDGNRGKKNSSTAGHVGTSLLSPALQKQKSSSSRPPRTAEESGTQEILAEPIKTVNTKHAGQQGLRIRSDGRIFATAGWDSRVRVYSCKTMKELAVLKWHQVGCYAIAFAPVGEQAAAGAGGAAATEDDDGGDRRMAHRIVDVTVKQRRMQHAKTAHWLAAGAKDGKVSLWEVY